MNLSAARLVRTWALDAVAHARELMRTDPTWGTRVVAVAGGWLVLSGPSAADLRVHDDAGGVATFGGMSALPAERRRGVQAALLRHRLELARAH